MFKRIDHVEIIPGDAEKTIDFYQEVLTFKIKSRQGVKMPGVKEIIYMELGDTVIEIIAAEAPTPKSDKPLQVGYRGIALEVESMDQAVEYLTGKGVAITMGPMDLGSSIRAEITDPDGLMVELREWK